MRLNEVRAITSIQLSDGCAVCSHSESVIGPIDRDALAASWARLILLYPEPLPLPEPYKVLQFRQVALPASRPIAIDTRRPLLEEAS